MVTKRRRDEILVAASRVFTQFGYRLTSMTQVAEQAGISRQALYLAFPSKQELFRAVVERNHEVELAEIRVVLSRLSSSAEKLMAALDAWFVRTNEQAVSLPLATELTADAFEFANQATNNATKEFEVIVARVIEPLLQGKPYATLTALDLARLLTTASIGFKISAGSDKELHGSLRALVSALLGSLGQIA